jgi:hypothetical protein
MFRDVYREVALLETFIGLLQQHVDKTKASGKVIFFVKLKKIEI